jgi:hypothetical protein
VWDIGGDGGILGGMGSQTSRDLALRGISSGVGPRGSRAAAAVSRGREELAAGRSGEVRRAVGRSGEVRRGAG